MGVNMLDLHKTLIKSHPKIGLYDGPYCTSFHLEVELKSMNIPYERFTEKDINKPKFGEYLQVLIFGAGAIYNSKTAVGGEAGKQKIKGLIKEGRSYVGICAGSFLALGNDPRCLNISKHEVSVPFTMSINTFQGFLNLDWLKGEYLARKVWYQNGPIYSHVEGDVIAKWSDKQPEKWVCSPKASHKPLDFANQPAVVGNDYGKGRVILLSPHFEFGSMVPAEYCEPLYEWEKRNDLNLGHRVPHGKYREKFLGELDELGYTKLVDSPQWKTFKQIIYKNIKSNK